jgi:capsular polysaccharide export protein
MVALPELLGCDSACWLHPGARPGQDAVFVGWGRRPSGVRAQAMAARTGGAFLLVEDGFLRSVALGSQEPPLSLSFDPVGVYYDAMRASHLECLVARTLPDADVSRARHMAQAWREGRVSKYNHARERMSGLPTEFVLVVDQTQNDASITCGHASEGSFARMLEAALDEHPQATVLLKVHPEVFASRKRGHFDRLSRAEASRVQVLGLDVHPAGLLERARAVYVVTSQMGFEALLWQKPVRAFGMPFYAGWGLTEDDLPAPRRRQPVALDSLVHAALIDYPRYIDPETGRRCEIETVLDHLALQRRMRERFPEHVYAVGFSRWKKPIAKRFLAGSRISFVGRASEAPADAAIATWGRKHQADAEPSARCHICLEDGFLRSVGLGADLITPLSWAADREGIYYDATRPSELETVLERGVFDAKLIVRARNLRRALVDHGVTKYNVGAGGWNRPEVGHRVVLVVGQVESDASIRLGTVDVRTNMGLLRRVRQDRPDAYVVYRPHPDVLAGLRKAGESEHAATDWCDEIVAEAPMGMLLDQVDEVHVLTSLAGFEALLRGRAVVTYGQPFYAGWGLTEDRCPVARRTRTLTLDELVAGALIVYPTYVSRVTGRFTTPERALEELLDWRNHAPSRMPAWRRALRWGLRSIAH